MHVDNQDDIRNLGITEESSRQASEFVKSVIELFSDHAKRMSDDITDFRCRQMKAKEQIQSGGRKTSGRIV